MTTLSELQRAYLDAIDPEASYRFARELEQFRTNPALGYRTAGSEAEYQTGELLVREMQRIGLQEVTKDAFTLDGWTFSHARLSFGGRLCELASYQTSFDTGGERAFPVVYAGSGTDKELSELDVRGRLVLIDINQREDWWVSYPAYQAHLHGAAAVIAAQRGGYGEVDPDALNAQNIGSIAEAPAFSISRTDADALKRWIQQSGGEANVLFDAKSTVTRDQTSYNIVGKLPGRDPDHMILLSAHYDSYFAGFQDDNAAVALMLGIARALLNIGYQPEKTLVFCAMAAEEWGVCNSKYDWSTGAYNQIFRVRPDWAGRVIAGLNFELPACAHGTQDKIRCVYELLPFLERFAGSLPSLENPYPEGLRPVAPVQTWSDDFSLSIGGVPSLVNEFAAGGYMQTHYHSQFDTEASYDASVFRFHHALYGLLVLACDRCAVSPLDFSVRLRALRDSLAYPMPALDRAERAANRLAQAVRSYNDRYAAALETEDSGQADRLQTAAWPLNAGLLAAFKRCEDAFTRLDWQDTVFFPHQIPAQNLALLRTAAQALEQGDQAGALEAVRLVDTNAYACAFDDATCRHFVEIGLRQPAGRLMWGAGRLMGACELFAQTRALRDNCADASVLTRLREEIGRQQAVLDSALKAEERACEGLAEDLEQLLTSCI